MTARPDDTPYDSARDAFDSYYLLVSIMRRAEELWDERERQLPASERRQFRQATAAAQRAVVQRAVDEHLARRQDEPPCTPAPGV